MTIALQLYSGTPVIQNQGKSEGLPKANHTIDMVGVYPTTRTLRSLSTGEVIKRIVDVVDTVIAPIDVALFEQMTINGDTSHQVINL